MGLGVLDLVGLVGFGWFGMLILKVIADRHGSLLEMLSHLKMFFKQFNWKF